MFSCSLALGEMVQNNRMKGSVWQYSSDVNVFSLFNTHGQTWRASTCRHCTHCSQIRCCVCVYLIACFKGSSHSKKLAHSFVQVSAFCSRLPDSFQSFGCRCFWLRSIMSLNVRVGHHEQKRFWLAAQNKFSLFERESQGWLWVKEESFTVLFFLLSGFVWKNSPFFMQAPFNSFAETQE